MKELYELSEGERRLWAKTLLNAKRTLEKGDPYDKMEAYEWLLSEEYGERVNTFLGICVMLDLDPDSTRKEIMDASGYDATKKHIVQHKAARPGPRATFLTAFGETKQISKWEEDDRCKVTRNALKHRVNDLRWSVEESITTEPMNSGKKGQTK